MIIQETIQIFILNSFKIPIHKIYYLQFDYVYRTLDTYVIHEPIKTLKQALVIIFYPFIVCTLICMLLTYSETSDLTLDITDNSISNIFLFLAWVSVSTGVYALPEEDYVKILEHQANSTQLDSASYSILKIIIFLFKSINKLRFLYIYLGFAFITAYMLPLSFGFA